MTTLYKFKTFFTKEGYGHAPAPAPTATVLNVATNTKLVDAVAATAKDGTPGLYVYEYSGADDLDLVCLFRTTQETTDQQELMSYVVDKVYQLETKIDSIDTDSVLGAIVEGAYTLQDFIQIMGGVLAGTASGGGTTTITFANLSNSGSIVKATVDSNGNRTEVLLNVD